MNGNPNLSKVVVAGVTIKDSDTGVSYVNLLKPFKLIVHEP